MGTCFGRCLNNNNNNNHKRMGYTKTEDEFNLVENVDANTSRLVYRIMKNKQKKQSKFISRFWGQSDPTNYKRFHRNDNNASAIQLQCLDAHSLLLTQLEKPSELQSGFYTGHTTPSATSSLELEWEHEYEQNNSWILVPEDTPTTANGEISSEDDYSSHNSELQKSTRKLKNFRSKPLNTSEYKRNKRSSGQRQSITANSSVASWSHFSASDSLEWDVDQDQNMQSEESLDQETRDLLMEIEDLKNRALNETGFNLEELYRTTES